MGIHGKIWGPMLWCYLHTLTMKYPDNPSTMDMDNMLQSLLAISKTLPCELCREHFERALSTGNDYIDPLTYKILKSKKAFIRWMYDFHDFVNKNKVLEKDDIRTQSPKFDVFVNSYEKNDMWKPAIWLYMHMIAATYKDKPTHVDRNMTRNVFMSIAKTMPPMENITPKTILMGSKTVDMKDVLIRGIPLYIKPIDVALKSRVDLFKWVYAYHKYINDKLNRVSPKYADVLRQYNIYLVVDKIPT